MNLHQQILTNNNCYKSGVKLDVKGIMWHSTGVNNVNIRRYVQPDDGYLGVNTAGNHWNTAKPDGRSVCVHAFIGKVKNGEIATYQTLPWNIKGWHCGGSANSTHIGFEICEDNRSDPEYFNAVYKEACELTAFLCKMFKLDPSKDGVIICHSEGAKRGVASSHADVMHWFPTHGKSMDTVRKDVKALMDSGATVAQNASTLTNIVGNSKATADQMRSYIKSKNPDVAISVLDMIPLYLTEGAAEGIRGDIAFAQSCLETGNFTFKGSAVTLDQNNFCGHGVTKTGMKGSSFATPQLGIRAQIQHLKAYATKEALINKCVDNRYKYVTKGVAPYVEWLGAKENPNGTGWAAGAKYGSKILTILNDIVGIKSTPTVSTSLYRVQCGAFSLKGNAVLLASSIQAAGFETFITKVGSLYKVQCGAFSSQEKAKELSDKLKAAGFANFIYS